MLRLTKKKPLEQSEVNFYKLMELIEVLASDKTKNGTYTSEELVEIFSSGKIKNETYKNEELNDRDKTVAEIEPQNIGKI